MMQTYQITFYKHVKNSDKRIAASMKIEAFNMQCAEAIASALVDNLPNNWYSEVELCDD
jgi:hypothetical protein